MVVGFVVAVVNVAVFLYGMNAANHDRALIAFGALAFAQLILGITSVALGIASIRRNPGPDQTEGIASIFGGAVLSLIAIGGGIFGSAVLAFSGLGFPMGGAWGRPLRVRGRQLHPELRKGSDWTEGDRPSPDGLAEPNRRALEALWLHDAQKEHASVPAFARVSWLLATVGAPPHLMAWSHRAALEEIEHTQRCFALAAGYGQRSHSVEPMPDLLLASFDSRIDPRVTLVAESVTDGCLLEDYNADVAAACARACTEPVTRGALLRIAKEERGHADFSWAVLEWLLGRDREITRSTLANELVSLAKVRRPTAVSRENQRLVEAADPVVLRAHGRLPDAEWGRIWDRRLTATRARLEALLHPAMATSDRDASPTYAAIG